MWALIPFAARHFSHTKQDDTSHKNWNGETVENKALVSSILLVVNFTLPKNLYNYVAIAAAPVLVQVQIS